MFSSENFISEASEIPSNWIFETYLSLEKLEGQTIWINSPLNTSDSTPSFQLKLDNNGIYKYHCFSSGSKGGAIDLLKLLWNKSFNEVFDILKTDFVKTDKSKITKIDHKHIVQNKWTIVDYTKVNYWHKEDQEFWKEYFIGSKTLRKYNVSLLKDFTMAIKHNDGTYTNHFKKKDIMIYGFFSESKELMKVYLPGRKPKFFTVNGDFLLGDEQRDDKDSLIITSSLKDIMSMSRFYTNADFISGTSETTLISKEHIDYYLEEYNGRVITFLNSDEAGILAMKKYEELYGIPFCYCPLESDFTDMIKYSRVSEVIRILTPKIHRAFEKCVSLRNERLAI